jgi:hypothetical protein
MDFIKGNTSEGKKVVIPHRSFNDIYYNYITKIIIIHIYRNIIV